MNSEDFVDPNGYVWLWRKSIGTRAFKNPELWKVWTWCLMRANHEESWVPFKTGQGSSEVLVKPGEFIFGRKSAAKELSMPASSVRNRMAKLENMQNLTLKQDTHYTMVSITNWVSYQSRKEKEDRQVDTQRTPKGHPKDTDKNVENEKNEKKKNIKTRMPDDFKVSERVSEWAKKKKLNHLEDHLEAFKLSCSSKGYMYVDWDAAFMNAIRNNWARLDDCNEHGSNNIYQDLN